MSEAYPVYLFKALSLSYFEYRRFKWQLFTRVCIKHRGCLFVWTIKLFFAFLYTTVSFTTHVKLTEFDFSIPSKL